VIVLLEVNDVGGTTFSNTFTQIETAKTNAKWYLRILFSK
jgi:hypothetical protein